MDKEVLRLIENLTDELADAASFMETLSGDDETDERIIRKENLVAEAIAFLKRN